MTLKNDARVPEIRSRYLLILDAATLLAAVWLAYVLRFDGLPPNPADRLTALVFALAVTPTALVIFVLTGLYRRLWSYASVAEVERIVVGVSIATICSAILGLLLLPLTGVTPVRVPISVVALNALLSGAFIVAPRLFFRVRNWHSHTRRRDDDMRAIIVGAGAAGQMIAKELLSNPELGLYPVAFVDDDPRKYKLRLHEIPVVGNITDIGKVAHDNDAGAVVIAMPSAPGSAIRRIVQAAADAGLKTRTLPPLSDVLSGRASPSSLRDVQIEDLLRRDPIHTDLAAVRNLAKGRTVLVTGAGGSIGSELCRQLAQLEPARLIILGHGENSIFDIQAELLGTFPKLNVVPTIADIRDQKRLHAIFDDCRPFAVFHTAAHKHVPLMEENVVEAITNNIFGTTNVVNAAIDAGVEHFVLISTDKAVRPTSIMGATKRLAERVVQHAAVAHGRNFVSVRFGNVLGSRGSVVPTFFRQIRAGGPVLVTHPDMRRYFMTIPESVQLVLQAGTLGLGGEVFVLDMGEPVKIVDLATDLIRLCGLEPGKDIEVQFTGIRPGEKLYEEMFFHEEHALPTNHPKLLRAKKAGIPEGLIRRIERLVVATETSSEVELREMLIALVPDFQREATGSDYTARDVIQLRRTGDFRINSAS
ncbi:MAG: nucleoside-diphosphate sugar epimerase/dehydratase [Gemmatimonadaceae bacterium]